MPGWFTIILAGMTITLVFLGPVSLLYRYILKRMDAEHEEERRFRPWTWTQWAVERQYPLPRDWPPSRLENAIKRLGRSQGQRTT